MNEKTEESLISEETLFKANDGALVNLFEVVTIIKETSGFLFTKEHLIKKLLELEREYF